MTKLQTIHILETLILARHPDILEYLHRSYGLFPHGFRITILEEILDIHLSDIDEFVTDG